MIAAVESRQELIDTIESMAAKHTMFPLIKDAPGLGAFTAGRLIGELGDDLGRFRKRGSMSRLAGVVPVQYQSNKKDFNRAAKARNRNLADIMYVWAGGAVTYSAQGQALNDRLKERGTRQSARKRIIANRLLRSVNHCWKTGEFWDDTRVWPSWTIEASIAVTAEKERKKADRKAARDAAKAGVEVVTGT